MSKTFTFIWFSACLVVGFYIRHWINTGAGQFRRFGEYYEKKQKLEKDLESNINYGTKEIERLETKLRTINKKKWELEQKLGQSQSEKARLEIKLINAENKEENIIPTPNFWTDYGPIILMVGLYFFICLIIK